MQINSIYFYTSTILNWIPVLQNKEYAEIIYSSLQHLVKKRKVVLYAYVIMPNHIHLLWKPLEKNLQLGFMRFTGQQIKFKMMDSHPDLLERFLVNKRDRIYQIWQRNPRAFEIWNRDTFEQKLDYIHNNPVQGKWRLSNGPLDYPYSSAAYYESELLQHDILTHYRNDI